MKFSLGSFSHIANGSRKNKQTTIPRFVNPVREWVYGLVLSSIIFLGIAGYTGFQFYSQYYIEDESMSENGGTNVYREKDIKDAIELYRNKESQFTTLRQDRSNAVIPTILTEALQSTSTNDEIIPLAEESAAE